MSRFVFKPPAAKKPDAKSTSGSLDSYLAATQEAEQALLLQQAAMAHAAVAPAQSSNLFAARFAGAAAAAGPASAAGPSLFAPAAAGGSLLAPSRFALPGFSEAAAAGPAAGAPPGVREPVRFNFDDLGGEVSEMAQQREQEIKDELNAARERVAVDAHAGMFAPLPSQDAESAALTAFVMDAMGRNWKGKVGRAQEKAAAQQQQQHRRGSAAAQRAMEVADKLEARVGGGNYRQAVKDAKRKARRRVEY